MTLGPRSLLIAALCLGACASDSGSSALGVVAVSGIELPETLRLDTASAKTATLKPKLTPADAGVEALSWKSDAPSVATVDASGVVTALAAGTATITASSHDGKVSASCKVYVFALYLHDDFESGAISGWDLRPPNGPDGKFSVSSDGTKVLSYDAAMTGGVLATATDAAWAKVPSGDYYLEARIKPKTNSSTGSKQLYLIARYQDDKNWYGAGLNVQSSTASTQVEIAKMKDGTLSRPVQVKTPIVMDTTWYTVRFELKASTLTVYLDGVEDSEIRSIADSAAADRGFVVQARSVAQTDLGFVFLRSRFTHGSDVPAGADAATFFARSSGNASAWDNVVIVDCDLSDHIHPLGWAYEVGGQPKSNPAMSSASSGWREYGSHGPGGDMSQRKNGYTLSAMDVQGAFSTRAQIFAAFDNGKGWNP